MKKGLVLLLMGFAIIALQACSVRDDSTLVVGLECDYAPFNWTTNDSTAVSIDGEPFYCDGYDVDIARLIADELDRELVIRQINWDGLIPALLAGQIDVIIAGMSPTPERAQTISFTDPYFVSEQVLVVRSDSAYADATDLSDFSGARVVAQMGTLQDDLIAQIPDVIHRTPLETYASLVSEVNSGASDALIAELPVALSIIATNPALTIVNLGENGFLLEPTDVSVSVALRKEDTALLENINTILSGITVATRNALMQAALDRQEG